jgi:hypothetical protein
MAIGMTMVEAINEVVETITEFPMSGATKPSASGDTTSVYRRAEDFIVREDKRMQSQGWPENTEANVRLDLATAVGSDDLYTVGIGTPAAADAASTFLFDTGVIQSNTAGSTLRVRGAGEDEHRTLVLRKPGALWSYFSDSPALFTKVTEVSLYDSNYHTFDCGLSGTRTTATLDFVFHLDFESISPMLQDVIVARSKMNFQRRMQGNPQVDQALQQEYIAAEASLTRNMPDMTQSWNMRPAIPQAAPQQKQG